MALPDISALLSSANDAFSAISSGSKAIQGIRTTQQQMAEDTASMQEAAGAAAAAVISADQAGKLQTQAAALKAGAIFGADLNQTGEKISQYARVQQEARDKRMALEQTIAEKQSVGFTDNPLQYIINQFTVNDDINKHNALVDVEDGAGKSIDDITRESSAVALNQRNFETSVTQASAKAKADEAVLKAQVQANETRTASLNYNVDALNSAINASKETLAIRFNINQAQNSQEQLRLAMANYALHKQEFDWRKEEKAKAAESDEFFIDRMQKGFKVMYGDKAPDLSMNPKLGRQMLTLLKSNTPAGKEAIDAYMAGQSGVLGGAPSQVIDRIYSGAQYDVKPGQEPILKLFSSAVQLTKGQDIKDDAQRQNLLNSAVNIQLEGMAKKIKPGDTDNVFNIGNVRTYLSMPGVSELPLVQKVLSSSQVDMNDPAKVYAETLRGVKEGTVSIEQAVDGLAAVYRKGVETNLASKELTRFGISLNSKNENVRNYKTDIQIHPGAFIGKSETVNLTDPNEVKRALLKTIGASIAVDMNKVSVPVYFPGM